MGLSCFCRDFLNRCMYLGSDQLCVNFSVVGISEMSLGFPDEGIEVVKDTAIALAELLDEV